MSFLVVIPAKAGIQDKIIWIPAGVYAIGAGMTNYILRCYIQYDMLNTKLYSIV